MSVAFATRLLMLKKPATAAISQMSRSVNPAARRLRAIRFLDPPRLDRQLPGEIEHRPRALVEIGGAIIRHDRVGELRIVRIFAHGRAMRDQAIMTMIGAGNGDRDQFALELRQARRRQHQIVGHGDEGLELGEIEGIGLQHIRHEAELFLAFREIGFAVGIERGGGKIERHRGIARRSFEPSFAAGIFSGFLVPVHNSLVIALHSGSSAASLAAAAGSRNSDLDSGIAAGRHSRARRVHDFLTVSG